ncbi:hypothetical protein [Bradyrhizobium sp. UFLA05-112]
MSEVLQTEMSGFFLRHCAILAALVGTAFDMSAVAAEDGLHKLSGPQIRAKLSGMQLTDEVHWREVYERDGRLRSYAMGKKMVGKWYVQADELCIDLPEPDGGCFEVNVSGETVVLKPTGLGLAADGVLRSPAQGE